ncbi:MAG: hypothetical protein ACWA5Q_09660 [bacterium]
MSETSTGRVSRPALPSVEFREYCEAEFERRRNSGNDFDEQAYTAAMEAALAKLKILEEEEGLA